MVYNSLASCSYSSISVLTKLSTGRWDTQLAYAWQVPSTLGSPATSSPRHLVITAAHVGAHYNVIKTTAYSERRTRRSFARDGGVSHGRTPVYAMSVKYKATGYNGARFTLRTSDWTKRCGASPISTSLDRQSLNSVLRSPSPYSVLYLSSGNFDACAS